jgi:hypothetical protein
MNARASFLATALVELLLAAGTSWALLPADERRTIKAAVWKAIETSAMRVAIVAATASTHASEQYKVTVAS